MSYNEGFPPDPVSSAVKGTLEYTEEKLKNLVKRFLDKEIVFVQDPYTIETIKKTAKKRGIKCFQVLCLR